MKISVLHRLYNVYGGQKSLAMAGYWLEHGCPDFGRAIDEIEITIYFYHDAPIRKSLGSRQDLFNETLKTLPKSKFLKKKRRFNMEIEGRFVTGYEIERQSKPPIGINPSWVESALWEIIKALPLLETKIKKDDDFDFSGFQEYCLKRLEMLPASSEEMQPVYDAVLSARKEKQDQLGPWEKLDISWGSFHPNARDLLPDPYFWSVTDEFSPNGNDSGEDTLELFKNWNISNKKKSPMLFLETLMKDWDIDMASPYVNEYSSYTYFQAVVGLTFASLKLRGECEDKLAKLALSAIVNQLNEVSDKVNWEHKDECESKLLKCKAALQKMA